MLKKRGGVEIATIIILIVIFGALAVSIIGAYTFNTKDITGTGLSKNNEHLENLYRNVTDELPTPTAKS